MVCVLQLDGLTGVPTRTTATLTPTTLRSIEQTFIDLQSQVESHQNQAGFVPPVIQHVSNSKFINHNSPEPKPDPRACTLVEQHITALGPFLKNHS